VIDDVIHELSEEQDVIIEFSELFNSDLLEFNLDKDSLSSLASCIAMKLIFWFMLQWINDAGNSYCKIYDLEDGRRWYKRIYYFANFGDPGDSRKEPESDWIVPIATEIEPRVTSLKILVFIEEYHKTVNLQAAY